MDAREAKSPQPKPPQHFVIVGGGIAGMFTAARLCRAGQRITLLDDGASGAASAVAAGLYNVITGRFAALTWMADRLLEELDGFFREAPFASLTAHKQARLIYRPFKEISEYNTWLSKSQTAAYRDHVRFQEHPVLEEQLHNPHGGIWIQGCGWMDVPPFLQALRHILEERYELRVLQTRYKPEQTDLDRRTLSLDGEILDFDQLIFCEGHRASENPLFPGLPVIPNKGEILRIRIGGAELDFLLSRKIYLIPLGNREYLVGSTYNNNFEDMLPSQLGREEILGHLHKAVKGKIEVLEHRAGIRPTTRDRRPVLGTHSELSFVHLFTGLGSKGILQAPYLSRLFVEEILGGGRLLPEEVSLQRLGIE